MKRTIWVMCITTEGVFRLNINQFKTIKAKIMAGFIIVVTMVMVVNTYMYMQQKHITDELEQLFNRRLRRSSKRYTTN